MIRINLLPFRVRIRKENVRQFISVYLLSVVLVLVSICYLWIRQNNQVSVLDSRLKELTREADSFAKYEKILQELMRKKEIIETKRRVIHDLQRDRDKLVRILALMSISLPAERVWFEKLLQSGNSITVEGIALSNETIAEFMRNLEASPYVIRGSINLVHSRLTAMGGMKLREFRLTCTLLTYSDFQEKLRAAQPQS
jgi:type IV pilus assembly protein PilN